MGKETIFIRYATIKDEQAVANFLIQQYKTAKEFEIIDINALSKQYGRVLIATNNDEIISTMRFEQIENIADLNIVDNLTENIIFNKFPTLFLSRAATLKSYRNTGLNSLLRLIILKNAILNHNIASITGCAYLNAPRMHLLEKLGYEISVVEYNDVSYAKSLTKNLFLCLIKDKFELALTLLESEIAPLMLEQRIENQINFELEKLNKF